MAIKGDETGKSHPVRPEEERWIIVNEHVYNLLKKNHLDREGRLINCGIFLDGAKVHKTRRVPSE